MISTDIGVLLIVVSYHLIGRHGQVISTDIGVLLMVVSYHLIDR